MTTNIIEIECILTKININNNQFRNLVRYNGGKIMRRLEITTTCVKVTSRPRCDHLTHSTELMLDTGDEESVFSLNPIQQLKYN